jgi:hypothetical protein
LTVAVLVFRGIPSGLRFPSGAYPPVRKDQALTWFFAASVAPALSTGIVGDISSARGNGS